MSIIYFFLLLFESEPRRSFKVTILAIYCLTACRVQRNMTHRIWCVFVYFVYNRRINGNIYYIPLTTLCFLSFFLSVFVFVICYTSFCCEQTFFTHSIVDCRFVVIARIFGRENYSIISNDLMYLKISIA